MIKSDQIQKLLLQSEVQEKKAEEKQQLNGKVKRHLIRAVMIVIDATKSMQIKDLKPSRLGLTIQMAKNFIKQSKDQTPIIKFSLAIVEQQLCKILVNFTYRQEQLIQALDLIKIQQNPGYFSLENTLRVTLDNFQQIPLYFHRQLFLIQSSTYTKDYRNIFDTIKIFVQSKIYLNIASLSGYNNICQKLSQSCHGRYDTIHSPQYFKTYIDQIAQPMIFKHQSIKKSMMKVAWCKKYTSDIPVQCFCHLKNHRNYYICGLCSALLCKSPPNECIVCGTLLLLPSDLYRFS